MRAFAQYNETGPSVPSVPLLHRVPSVFSVTSADDEYDGFSTESHARSRLAGSRLDRMGQDRAGGHAEGPDWNGGRGARVGEDERERAPERLVMQVGSRNPVRSKTVGGGVMILRASEKTETL